MGIPAGNDKEGEPENFLEEIVAEISLILERKQKSTSRKPREFRKSWTQKGAHQDTLYWGSRRWIKIEYRNVFEEIVAENVPNLKKETDIQKQEPQRVPSEMNQNRPMSSHIIIKMAKVKENSKGSKSKTKSYIQGNLHKAFSWLLAETLQARKEQHNTFKVPTGKNLQTRTILLFSQSVMSNCLWPRGLQYTGFLSFTIP